MKKISFGVLGFGTVGSGVVKLFQENRTEIRKRLGFDLELKAVAEKTMQSKEGVTVPDGVLTDDAMNVINDPEVDIVVELIGGTGISKKLILESIAKGKHVVTANKALLAEHGGEIFDAAEKCGRLIGYEASVAGVIPIIRTIKESLASDRIESVYGIINGTCNYILTRMAEEGKGFVSVLADAQKLGYAEADPKLDVEGIDAAHKLAILASLSFGVNVKFDEIFCEGITRITPLDIELAADFGYSIKLLGIAKKTSGEIEARVHPTLIPKKHPLASVRMEFNAIFVKGVACGPMLLYGKGAGMMPTASAVLGDVVDIARHLAGDSLQTIPNRGYRYDAMKETKIKSVEDITGKYYIRMNVVDRPGVLATIAGVLGTRQISIESVIQQGRSESGEGVPLVIISHETVERELHTALVAIERMDCCLDKPVVLRIEDGV